MNRHEVNVIVATETDPIDQPPAGHLACTRAADDLPHLIFSLIIPNPDSPNFAPEVPDRHRGGGEVALLMP